MVRGTATLENPNLNTISLHDSPAQSPLNFQPTSAIAFSHEKGQTKLIT
ncbi:hypothetical protein Cflav_PD0913 [Pedosphaera parvula Ellin514]|uniref:Uncharacterized protein n=1 Tax=Pedosphaera parvula (strain Ellin514) TaxID=320771 RepID=B9XQV6_PEDPL|nr:hypothetical protein Cflav_PD0913 [Pedosphaera parvula Ellin514]